jgi:MHS family proline/betaine transporter-like MFS transporter
MPNHLAATRQLNLASVLLMSAAALIIAATAAVVLGRLSDRAGRRPVAIWSTVVLGALAAPASLFASTSGLGLAISQLAIGAAIGGVLLVAMVGELFPTSLRSTGLSMTAGLATALLGGTAPIVDQILVHKTES